MSFLKFLFGNLNEIFMERGIAYYPLQYDDHSNGVGRGILKRKNSLLIKGIDVKTILDNASKLNPLEHDAMKRKVMQKLSPQLEENKSIDERLNGILFEILPHYLDRKKHGLSKNPSRGEILEVIRKNYKIPMEFYGEAKIHSPSPGKMPSMEIAKIKVPEGMVPVEKLESIARQYVENSILSEEVMKIREGMKKAKTLSKEKFDDIATLLFLQNLKSFRLGDFGFVRDWRRIDYDENYNQEDKAAEYTLTLDIGAYALRDFDGEVYALKKCQIAVGIYGKTVGDVFVRGPRYNHPFLAHDYSNENICIGKFRNHGKTLEQKAINLLDVGKNVLLHGYCNENNFAGYGTLDECGIRKSKGGLKITNDAFLPDDVPRRKR